MFENEASEGTLCLDTQRSLDTAALGEAEQVGPDTASSSADEVSKSLTQQSDISANSLLSTLLALLALPHIRNL